ncbi:hypothetical protein NEMBOFW57_001082 [Staphylotrichum longicolle]|uniref:Uncharacterized protein n=1 Tax=Staphylotrichum longicolle TaxID=669026 RepID=A0AAD4F0U2_9PEZI|nr:hypothetical protein NEMBOFW57_001082 [Staphylotrichum longicolle]
MGSRLESLPAELRRAIVSLVIWARTPPPDFTQHPFPDRVRLRDDLSVWVEPMPRRPAALLLLLTSRTLHHDVRSLVSSGAAPYELDIAFIDECGLFPTWTICPLPSQTHIPTLRASIRILSAEEIDSMRPCREPASGAASTSSAVDDRFVARFPGSRNAFIINRDDPLPPPGACNFYHLLTRFFALGPLGAVTLDPAGPASLIRSPARRRRYTLDTLTITTISKPPSFWDTIRWLQRHPIEISSNRTDIPFGAPGEPLHFPALLPAADFPEYVWSGPATPHTVDTSTGVYAGERLGLYLALGVGGLLNLSAPLGRAFGRRLYEGVLGTVEFWVDGKRRARPVYDTERLLALLLPPPNLQPEDVPPDMAEGLEGWRRWVVQWKGGRREDVSQGRIWGT